MKKAIVILVSLCLVLTLLPEAITGPDTSSYDPMADVNRDGIIDVNDLYRVGQAYGSVQAVPFQSNKTVVYVYQLEADPPEVENARVAIIDLDVCTQYSFRVEYIEYTDSVGLVNFTLQSTKNYTAIAWSDTTYNYANFTTNEFGEASIAIILGYPKLPPNWVAITVLNETGGLVITNEPYFRMDRLVHKGVWEDYTDPYSYKRAWVKEALMGECIVEPLFHGIVIFGPWSLQDSLEPDKSYGVWGIYAIGGDLATPVFTLDANCTANVVCKAVSQ